jgi:hypothetical protein
MVNRIAVLDGVFFIAFTTALTIGITTAPWLAWPLFAWAAYHRTTMYEEHERVMKEWFNWFEISKLIGVISGLASIFWYQYKREYSETSHVVVAIILAMNIAQAVVSDLQHGWRALPNALTGIFLITTIPRHALDVDRLATLAASGLFILPVTYGWSALYTTWNCAFSYGGNFSWSTRVIMVVPWILSWHFDEPGVWIGARCICLCLNMILRATETTSFYTPGLTFLTQDPNTIKHNRTCLLFWNTLNAFFGCIMWWYV